MERQIVITKRFRHHTFRIYQYLLKKFSSRTAFLFLDKIEERIELVAQHPIIGKKSVKKEGISSVPLAPYNSIFYRIKKNRIEILGLFDTRKNPAKRPF